MTMTQRQNSAPGCHAQADEIEATARLMSMPKDRDTLLLQAAWWRKRADQSDSAAANALEHRPQLERRDLRMRLIEALRRLCPGGKPTP